MQVNHPNLKAYNSIQALAEAPKLRSSEAPKSRGSLFRNIEGLKISASIEVSELSFVRASDRVQGVGLGFRVQGYRVQRVEGEFRFTIRSPQQEHHEHHGLGRFSFVSPEGHKSMLGIRYASHKTPGHWGRGHTTPAQPEGRHKCQQR